MFTTTNTTTNSTANTVIGNSCTDANFATTPSSTFTGFVLDRLRYAHIRAQIVLIEINSVSMALKCGLIDAEGALACLAESGLFDFVTGHRRVE